MLALLLIKFGGNPGKPGWLIGALNGTGFADLADGFEHWIKHGPDHRFHEKVYWASARIVAYLLLPAVVVRCVFRESLSSYGFSWSGLRGTLKIYAACAALLVLPLVVASFGEAFQRKYPFYKLGADESLWPFFWGWELLYAAQFVALEFFFRGFLLHGLRPRLGYSSIFVMTVPYMMIHFAKPLPEAMASIVAGVVLGTLSYKSLSIWGGVALHVFAAWSMDLLSLLHQGRFS